MGVRPSPCRQRGSVSLEAVLALPPLCAAVLGCAELARRSYVEVLAHHGAFLVSRAAALDSRQLGSREIASFWRAALGHKAAGEWEKRANVTIDSFDGVQVTRVHLKYPVWLSFPWGRGRKRFFEVTRRCRFPISP